MQGDHKLQSDTRLLKRCDIYFWRISIEDIIRFMNEKVHGDVFKLGEYWSDKKHLEMSMNISNMQISKFALLISDLTGGEWMVSDNRYILELKENLFDLQKRWWRLYESSKQENFKKIVSLRKEDFSGSVDDAWKKMPSSLVDHILSDIDVNQFCRLRPVKTLRNFDNAKLIYVNKNFFPQSLVKLLKDSFLNFQELNENDLIDLNSIAISYNNNLAKISFILKGRRVDTGNALDLRGSLSGVSRDILLCIFKSLQLDHRELVGIIEQKPSIADKGQKDLATLQKRVFWDVSGSSRKLEAEKISNAYRRDIILYEIWKQKKFSFISDIYQTDEEFPDKKYMESLILKNPIDIIQSLKYSWDISVKEVDSLYLIRNNRWYRDDRLAVRHDYCKSIFEKIKILKKYDSDNSSDSDISEFDRRFWLVVLDIFKTIDMYKILNGLFFFVPKDQEKSIESELQVLPLSFLSNFVLLNYNIIKFVSTLDALMLDGLLNKGLVISSLHDEQKKLLSDVVPVWFPQGNPVIEGTKIKMIFETSQSAGSIDMRTLSAPRRLLSGTYRLISL